MTTPPVASPPPPTLAARRLGLHTRDEALVLLAAGSPVCRSEGLAPRARVLLRGRGGETIATLLQVADGLIAEGEAGLSEAAWKRLGVQDGEPISISHPGPLESAAALRRRIFGHPLGRRELTVLIREIAEGRLSEIQIAAFLSGCTARPLEEAEILDLTQAMVDAGERLSWPAAARVFDKHSVGGLPGNRTSPLVVAIVAAHGLPIPKTSSRAITSPSGTADTMETLTRVDLDLVDIRRVVEAEHGCLAWGGSMRLSPADEMLIRVERALDIDPEGQLVASVLSKKIAAGASHTLIEMPVGPTAKVRDDEAAARLKLRLERVGGSLGMEVQVLVTDGSQPVGRGIGPALEARDLLAVFQGALDAPADLGAKACRLAGLLLEAGGVAPPGLGEAEAAATLRDGRAWAKFQAICRAQGMLKEPPVAAWRHALESAGSGVVASIDNRRLARLAKLAGAPDSPAAGLELHVRLGDRVEAGQPLLTLHAESSGELDYALAYAAGELDVVRVAPL
jgi:thymidine phosphorylase